MNSQNKTWLQASRLIAFLMTNTNGNTCAYKNDYKNANLSAFISSFLRARRVFAVFVMALGAQTSFALELSTFSSATGATPPTPWQYMALPERYAKPLTLIDTVDLDSKKVLRMRANKSWGTVVHPWTGDAKTIQFQWRLDKALTQANFSAKATEDAALKICASFDMPADRIPSGERTLFKLAQFFSRDKLPTATLCYVWANTEAVGSIHPSPTTARVRYFVLDSGSANLKTWKPHKRNLSDDFLKAFGAEAKDIPPISAIIVGADSDNTADTSLSYVADILVQP